MHAPPTAVTASAPSRLTSLDAFRGAVLLLMASSGLGIPQIARATPHSRVWELLGVHCEHAAWAGCTLWDLIQPAFLFMVGMAIPWSVAGRLARGQDRGSLLLHALWRAVMLVLLGVFLTSAWSRSTEWVFTNVLAQIGLGYPVLFLLALAGPRVQWAAVALLLTGCWLLFALHPTPPPGFDWASVGVPPDWPHLSGFAAHWEKNANAAADFDAWFLNLFPRESPFVFSAGGYQTLNFVPSIATMLLGTIAGEWMRRPGPLPRKLLGWVAAGLAGIALGKGIELAGGCPIVKRLWTPSWTLYSAGWVVLLLSGFVAVIELAGWRRWTFPLVVAGLNPITLYCLWQLSAGFVRDSLKTHLGQGIFQTAGALYAPMLERFAVVSVFWLVLLWMHRRKLYLRL